MSDFKLEFTLKQHTPIIHFQAKQKGATLRATELKPKLDRFLINYFKNQNIDYKDFLIAGQESALNYKVAIREDVAEQSLKPYPSKYIGNTGKEDHEKIDEKFTKGSISIVFKLFRPTLYEAIKINFSNFLLQHNFAARTSKGNGSFYLFDKEKNEYIIPDFSQFTQNVYSFNTIRENAIKDIGIFSAFLRSGFNYPKHNDKKQTRLYLKSVLFNYLQDRTDLSGDKKAIKHAYSPKDVGEDTTATLARDLFGLSSRQEWGDEHNGMVITKTSVNDKITRFKSPLFFKPLISSDINAKPNAEMTVYFMVDDSYKKILGEEFNVLANNRGSLKLSIPKVFDFDDFFNYLIKDYQLNVDSNYASEPEIIIIKRILTDIRRNFHE